MSDCPQNCRHLYHHAQALPAGQKGQSVMCSAYVLMRNSRTKLSACGLGQNSLNMMGLSVIILALQCIQATKFFLHPIADWYMGFVQQIISLYLCFRTWALSRLSPFTCAVLQPHTCKRYQMGGASLNFAM